MPLSYTPTPLLITLAPSLIRWSNKEKPRVRVLFSNPMFGHIPLKGL